MLLNIISYVLPFAGLLLLILTFHVLERQPFSPDNEKRIDESNESQ